MKQSAASRNGRVNNKSSKCARWQLYKSKETRPPPRLGKNHGFRISITRHREVLFFLWPCRPSLRSAATGASQLERVVVGNRDEVGLAWVKDGNRRCGMGFAVIWDDGKEREQAK